MRLLSPILQRLIYPALGRAGYFHARSSNFVGVVTYHGVLPQGYQSPDPFMDDALVSIESFRSQLLLLKKHYNVISPERFRRWLRREDDLPPRAIMLTCDDGLLNCITTMLPVLRDEGLQCLFFVTGALLGGAPAMLWYLELYLMLTEVRGARPPVDWQGSLLPAIPDGVGERRARWPQLMKALSRIKAERRSEFLSDATRLWGLEREWKNRYLEDPLLRQRFQLIQASELKQLIHAGMTVGAHTITHPILAEQSADMARAEISDCKQILEQLSGTPVWALAYPFGDPASVGDREYKLAQATGYECAFLNVGGSFGRAPSKFSLPRIHVTASMSLPVYEAHVSGFHSFLQARLSEWRLESGRE